MKIVKIDTRPKPQAGSKGGFTPAGKHKKKYKMLIKFIETMGFVFASNKNKVVYKHPDRKCQIIFASTPSDRNAPSAIVQNIKKTFAHCQPPIALSKIPDNIMRMKMAGMSWQEEKDKTMEDVLDSILLLPDYERVSTEMTADGKKDLKSLAEKKGLTMGELIEEMMIVYKDRQ